jgi:hypothetical protein
MPLRCYIVNGVNCKAGFLVMVCVLLPACHSQHTDVRPSIEFSRVPQASDDGRDRHDIIEGRVIGVRQGQQIVLYAHSGAWWIQPLVNQPFTNVQPDSKWTNATHLGTEYAALLVEPGYQPPATAKLLPTIGGGVAAIAIVKGQKFPPSPSLHFSGYEWRVRDAPSSRGGWNLYEPRNVWTDESGALHLRIARASGKWTCAELTLTRSLGYGTYSFTVRDTSRLEPAAVFGLFTWDYAGADQNHREMDIEISRWGDPASQNAQYVVQPFYIPRNVLRFSAPSGALMHSVRWESGRVIFKTVRTSASGHAGHTISEHVFTSGVPSPGMEAIRMCLYVFGQASTVLRNGAEVVIDKFEYLP